MRIFENLFTHVKHEFGQVWASLGKFRQVWARQQSNKIKMKHKEAIRIRTNGKEKVTKIEW